MPRVQMLQHISGGRADGTEWPHLGEILDTDEDEARHLVSGGNARWAVEPGAEERAVMPADGPELAAAVPADDSAGDEPPDAENGSQPLVRDPKQAWVDHAVENGATPEEAAAMTKADLIEKYGNPA